MIDRRDFLRRAIAAGSAPGVLSSAVRNDTPNILVIMSDEHNRKVAGCYGNAIARTPNLDRLAREGVTFDSAYCNSPLCVPSRLAFTTGKYIHRVNAWSNSNRLTSDDYPSLPRAMNAAGYESFLCGKQHYDAAHRYGFTEIGGNMNNTHHDGRGGRRQATDESVNLKGSAARFADFRAGEDSSVMSHDRKVTAGVLDFLGGREPGGKPFFLFAGYLAPHFPLTAPESLWQHYRDRIPMPEIPAGFLESMPLNFKHLRRGFGLTNVSPEVVKRGRELYYALTEWVDAQIGLVLAALRKSAFAENTVILYTSDHGENMGEHGLWWKNCTYEQAAHVPLICRWPARWKGGQRREAACSLVDVAQSIAAIGKARVPADWNGASLLPWLDQPATKWRDLAISQYYGHNIASGYAMLRTGPWKYTYHSSPDAKHGPERELYRLDQDPQEFKNLAGKPEFRAEVDRLHKTLVDELGEHPDDSEARCRRQDATGYGTPSAAASAASPGA
ncbi:MAG: sulfatase-like hydrolase/transferase [Acidobacteria bacterium]|nr:sulfatase-like hydrolase/transferase [Acidobacteriota bacterium]